jgi:diguanylate cyclase (GGDEF)-like protein
MFVYRAIVIIFFIFSNAVFSAMQPDDSLALQNMEHELNQQPWNTYQKILTQANSLNNVTLNYKLWWLLRKAQAENLLYLFEKLEETITKAQLLINDKSPPRIAINFNIFKGIILQRQGKYQKSQNVLKAAQQAAIKLQYTDLAVYAKLELAYTRSLTELYDDSLTDLQQAYVEAFVLNDNFLVAKVNEVYGAIYGYLHDYQQSIEYYQKALTSYQQLAYPAHVVEAIYGLAVTYRYWKKFDLALEYYFRYQTAIEFSPNNIDGKFYALYGISMSYAGKGDCENALNYIEKSLSAKGLIDYKAELYKRQAQCFIENNELDLAETALDNAAAIFANISELQGTRWQLEVIEIRSQLLQAKGDNQQAYRLLKQFNQSKIALLKKNNSDRLLRVRATLEIERKNIEISLLQQRTKVNTLQLEQQKQDNVIQMYIIGFIIILILFGLIFIYFQWKYNKKLLELSIRDPLSDLYNRRYIFQFFNKIINAINLEKNQVSIMLIDIDDFKRVNDLYGHSFGDKVISEVARISKDTLRVEDVIGRVGGEEFLCVLPRIDSIQCLHIAQRLVKRVNDNVFYVGEDDYNQQQVNISVSVGISTTSVETINSADLYLQADKALYHAKSRGKNRAIQYRNTMQHSYLKQD